MKKLASDHKMNKASPKSEEENNEGIAPKKIVIRRLPPTMTEAEFLEQISPLPPHEDYHYVTADFTLGADATCRAYITMKNYEDIFLFQERFDGYVFVDKNGVDYPAIVEFAPFQGLKIVKPPCIDPLVNTLEQTPHYQQFLKKREEESKEISMKPSILNFDIETRKKIQIISTPLLDFLEEKDGKRESSSKVRKGVKRRQHSKEKEIKKDIQPHHGGGSKEASAMKCENSFGDMTPDERSNTINKKGNQRRKQCKNTPPRQEHGQPKPRIKSGYRGISPDCKKNTSAGKDIQQRKEFKNILTREEPEANQNYPVLPSTSGSRGIPPGDEKNIQQRQEYKITPSRKEYEPKHNNPELPSTSGSGGMPPGLQKNNFTSKNIQQRQGYKFTPSRKKQEAKQNYPELPNTSGSRGMPAGYAKNNLKNTPQRKEHEQSKNYPELPCTSGWRNPSHGSEKYGMTGKDNQQRQEYKNTHQRKEHDRNQNYPELPPKMGSFGMPLDCEKTNLPGKDIQKHEMRKTPQNREQNPFEKVLLKADDDVEKLASEVKEINLNKKQTSTSDKSQKTKQRQKRKNYKKGKDNSKGSSG